MEQYSNITIVLFIFLFGLIIGSFLNCFIWRIRQNESMGGRSYCPRCGHKLAWYDNIPLLSYLLLGGKCRYCKEGISVQYPLVEFVTAFLFVLSFTVRYKESLIWGEEIFFTLIRDWFTISVLVFIFVYDLRWYLIPDKIILPATGIVLAINLFLGVGWLELLISAIIGAGFFLLQFVISRGMWIGGGDIRMGLFIGVTLGYWQQTVVALFFAYLLGSAVGIPLILSKKKQWGEKIPFGVFLAVATILTLFWGGEVLNWYLGYLI